MNRNLLLALALLALGQSPAFAQSRPINLSDPFVAARRAADCHAAVTATDPTNYARDTLRWRFALDKLGQWSSAYGYGLRTLRRSQNRDLTGCAQDLALLNAQLETVVRTTYQRNWQANSRRFEEIIPPLETHPSRVIDQAAWCAHAMDRIETEFRTNAAEHGFDIATPEGQRDLISLLVTLRVAKAHWTERLNAAPNGGENSPDARAARAEFDEWVGRFWAQLEDEPGSTAWFVFIGNEGLMCKRMAEHYFS